MMHIKVFAYVPCTQKACSACSFILVLTFGTWFEVFKTYFSGDQTYFSQSVSINLLMKITW